MTRTTITQPFVRKKIQRNPIKETIWVVGDGRSGTTWLADLINHRKRYRFMFEPFHPLRAERMRQFREFQYITPDNEDPNFYDAAQAVFSGQLRHKLIDNQNQYDSYSGLLAKDITANLFIKWVDVQFSRVKKVMILRHPCSVALSKLKLNRWNWPYNPATFFNQPQLCRDYLSGFEHVPAKLDNKFEKYILVWAILHYVPLKQLDNRQVHIVFYEELCTNPERELGRLFSYLGEPTTIDPGLWELLKTPSQTSREHSAIHKGKNLINGWRRKLTKQQVQRAIDILALFGLDRIYSDDLSPNREQAENMLRNRA
jgi:hypothetical protein